MLKNRMLHYFLFTAMLFLTLQFGLYAQEKLSLNNSLKSSSTEPVVTEIDVPAQEKAVLMVARPSSSDKRSNPEFPWISSFVHEYILFRLGAVTEIKLVNPDTLTSMISSYRSYKEPAVSESPYLSKYEYVNASHLLMTECKIQKNNSAVQFSMKVVPVRDQGNIISVNSSTCELNKIDECLDACITQVISGLQIEPSAAFQKFIKTRVAGDGKCDKAIGSAVLSVYGNKKQNPKNSAEDLKKCANQGENTLLAYYLSSQYYAKAGDYANAATILKDCIFKLGPTDAALYPICAKYYHKTDKLENALQMIKVAEGLKLVTNDLVVEKALLLEAMEEDDDAAGAYRDVLKFDPSNFDALLFLMHKANKDKDFTAALEYANTFRQLYRDDGRGDLEAGKAYFAVLQLPDAQSALTRAADILTANAEPRILLGDVYAALSNHNAALDQYERALDLSAENVDLHVKIAQTCLLMGKPEMSVETLKKIQKKHYDNAGLLKVLGCAEYQTGDTAGARKELSRYIQSGAPDHTVFFTLGEIYDNAGEYAQALDYYERAAALDPGDRVSPQRIAEVHQKMSGSEYTEKVKKKKERRESAEQRKRVSPRLVIRIGSGIVGIGAFSAGYLMNSLVKKDYAAYNDYSKDNIAQPGENAERVAELHKSIEQKMLYRNVLYSLGALGGAGVSITFIF
jgi:tetratricopeptide (TPR) repeat protein